MEFYYHDVDRDILIVSADGGLNAQTADQFISGIETMIDGGARRLIVDCTQLRYISSSGLGLLIRLHNRMAKHGGDVKLACVRGAIASMITKTRLSDILQLYPGVDDARAAFHG
jgi:anti-anti-sigma factor